MASRVLIAGVSTRGLAESAARAGYEVVAVDGFGDLDLRACAADVRVARVGGRFGAHAAAAVARDVASDAVVYVANFENHPSAVRALARGRTLWGNRPAVLAHVRDPLRLRRTVPAWKVAAPRVRATAPREPDATRWLLKPRASGGGSGIVRWRPGMPVPRATYLQRRIAGQPGSAVFAADGNRVMVLGVSRMLVGERAFGASGFRYCGNILWRPAGGDMMMASIMATAVPGLVGVNGIDFVTDGRGIHPIEVNPRYTASMELIERATGLSIFQVHVAACTGRLALRYPELEPLWRGGDAFGKAVVYAKRDVVIGETHAWLEDDSVRDIPPPGERIARGRPVCTVFARGKDAEDCYRSLVRRAEAIYGEIEGRKLRRA
jgi:predicted ATP-grasp superfamily ATP-dependent carboligase